MFKAFIPGLVCFLLLAITQVGYGQNLLMMDAGSTYEEVMGTLEAIDYFSLEDTQENTIVAVAEGIQLTYRFYDNQLEETTLLRTFGGEERASLGLSAALHLLEQQGAELIPVNVDEKQDEQFFMALKGESISDVSFSQTEKDTWVLEVHELVRVSDAEENQVETPIVSMLN